MEGLLDTSFNQIAALLLISALFGAVALRLRQPLIVAFIAVGLVAGPAVLGLVAAEDELVLLSEIGVALVLFVVGLKLDLRLVRALGRVALVGGSAQVALTAALGAGVAYLFGFSGIESLYVGLAMAFSSTIIVIKLLSDNGEIDELQGKLAVGFLIVQDLVVIAALIVLPALAEDKGWLSQLGWVVIEVTVLLAALALLSRWGLPSLLHRIAHSGELLVLFAIAWAIFLAAVGDQLELGKEVGAFLAGVSLASTPYREAIGARLTTVRDFLLLFFFVVLGSSLTVAGVVDHWPALLALSGVVLVLKPLTVMLVLPLLGYRKRVAFLTGLTLAQISEFSLILAASGAAVGHLTDDVVSLITLVAAVTIFASTFLIVASESIYAHIEQWLPLPQRGLREHSSRPGLEPEVVVFGLGRLAHGVIEGLRGADMKVLGVDYDPRTLELWRAKGIEVAYGDAEDPETPRLLPLTQARWVVSTLRRLDANLALLEALRRHGYSGSIAVAAHSHEDGERLRVDGADLVLQPYRDAGTVAVGALAAADLRRAETR